MNPVVAEQRMRMVLACSFASSGQFLIGALPRRLAVQMIFPDLQAELEFSMRQLLSIIFVPNWPTGCRNYQYNSSTESILD